MKPDSQEKSLLDDSHPQPEAPAVPSGPERPDRPEESCGVFGVYAPGEDVARLTYFGLHALQHRGQESAGIAVGDNETVTVIKNLGLVSRVFRESDLDSLTGDVAIGHTRYSTTGSSTSWENAQPHLSTIGRQVIALAHNGNLVNTHELREDLKVNGIRFRSTTDSEVIATLIGSFTQQHNRLRDGVRDTMQLIRGAYAVVLITERALYAFRDPYGVRPLVLGKLDDRGWVVASETCGLDIVGAEFVRDVAPGEMIKISEDGVESDQAVPAEKPSLCVFEFIYFARPDSVLYDCTLYEARSRMGAAIARSAPVEADLVMGVPDSGVPAAVGYAQASGIPFGEGLVKNRYVGQDVHLAHAVHSPAGHQAQAEPPQARHQRQAPRRRRRLDRAWEHEQEARRSSCARRARQRCTCASRRRPFAGPASTASTRTRRSSSSLRRSPLKRYASSSARIRSRTCRSRTLWPRPDRPGSDYCMACFDGEYPVEIPDAVKQGKLALEGCR